MLPDTNAPHLVFEPDQTHAAAALVDAVARWDECVSLTGAGFDLACILDQAEHELSRRQIRCVRAHGAAKGGLALHGLIAQIVGRTESDALTDQDLQAGFKALVDPGPGKDRVALLVADAHTLLPASLRYIQLACRSSPKLRVVLAGQAGLAALLAPEEFSDLRQRITRKLDASGPFEPDAPKRLPGVPPPPVPASVDRGRLSWWQVRLGLIALLALLIGTMVWRHLPTQPEASRQAPTLARAGSAEFEQPPPEQPPPEQPPSEAPAPTSAGPQQSGNPVAAAQEPGTAPALAAGQAPQPPEAATSQQPPQPDAPAAVAAPPPGSAGSAPDQAAADDTPPPAPPPPDDVTQPRGVAESAGLPPDPAADAGLPNTAPSPVAEPPAVPGPDQAAPAEASTEVDLDALQEAALADALANASPTSLPDEPLPNEAALPSDPPPPAQASAPAPPPEAAPPAIAPPEATPAPDANPGISQPAPRPSSRRKRSSDRTHAAATAKQRPRDEAAEIPAPANSADQRRCHDINSRAQLGKTPTEADLAFLRNGCRAN